MKRDLRNIISATMILGLALPGLILAQYDIPTAVIGGGGGVSSSTSYQLSGTVGIPAGGIGLSSTSYELDGGFWPTVQALTAGLEGVLVIGPDVTDDYATFGEAVSDLEASGVSGAVTFQVKAGTYTEQVSIPLIGGVSTTNTITFEPHPDNSGADVVLTYSPTTNPWIVDLYGAQHITIKGLKLVYDPFATVMGNAISITQNVDNITILNNTIEAYAGTISTDEVYNSAAAAGIFISSTTGNVPDNVTVRGNTIKWGSCAVWAAGMSNERMTGIVIEHNTVVDPVNGGIHVDYADGPNISFNSITTNISTVYTGFYGVSALRSINNILINGNDVDVVNGGIGLHMNTSGGGSSQVLHAKMVNNVVHTGGTGWSQGVKINALQQPYSFWDVYHNTIEVTGTSPDQGIAFWHVGAPDNYSLNLKNNIFANPGGGYAIRFYEVLDIATSDYNDIWSTRSDMIDVFGTTYDLAGFQMYTGAHDYNSLSTDPQFVNPVAGDYHLQGSSPLIGKGDASVAVAPVDT
ncbi:MAG: right-handed parallel beta-helix repeat-containing protein, partial [Fidelibacterota bacterium]